MAVLKIKANVKEQVKISEVKQGIELFSAIEGLIEHNTLVKSVFKGILDSLYSTLCDYEGCEDSDFVSFISPEDTATFFENYFNAKEKGTSVVKMKSAYVSRGSIPGTYVIKKGSRIRPKLTESVGAATKARVKELIEQGVIDSDTGFVNNDAVVNSASMAATIINGTPTSGKQIFGTIIW